MENLLLTAAASFIVGLVSGYALAKIKNSENTLFTMLNDFKRTLDEYRKESSFDAKEIKEAVKTAQELSRVLTTNQNLKGKFGEECLEAIIKVCYPDKNINYIKQFSSTNCDDKKIKPDYLINLPNDKSISIDCKLNLEKYIEYKENQTPLNKSELIKDLNQTVNKLSSKYYESAKDTNQTDFILMYIPLEPVITLIYTDKDFYNVIKNANDKNIIIVGNSSILTTLKLVNQLWAQEKQQRNIDKVINTAQDIYNLIATHANNLYQIKTNLENNLNDFNKEYKKLGTSTKLFSLVNELREYGLKPLFKQTGKKREEVAIPKEFLNN